MAKKHPQKPANLIAQNKKAGHDYSILETFEAGLVLTGTEIKSVRKGKINLRDGFARVRNGEAYLENVHISPYEQGNQFNHDPLRNRKLLLHRKEIDKLVGITKNKGITIVPLKVYLKHGFAKVLIGVGQGKHEYDKRETLKRKEQDREMARVLKNR
ncbi:SsrA-binding protein SmpB [Latilactobacillus fuchuensis]|uniref:SsrA-binding protein n=2 Tax=Latilactobacillus fuchuensis TaxID=164393 RepID=A0A2N9DWQ9_9LACO|nr:SsrA-binding protein SmpB [Latilactobacillus fuchuensis]KRL61367.1 ssrA-binding protein [Latilactobacillus fuchuensis DSM 14340 = JCM 11249]MCP8857365.1 SsrA-binding protein SmpB [Latilactobacillus fuchuensis]SPC39106.1 tmRNA-binding protein [Latilactobacillus fuchuensis]